MNIAPSVAGKAQKSRDCTKISAYTRKPHEEQRFWGRTLWSAWPQGSYQPPEPSPKTRDRGFAAQGGSREMVRASAKYQIAPHLTRAASPGKIPLHGEAQRLRSVRRGGDRRADRHGRNHGGRCLSPLRRVGCPAVHSLDVRPKAEPHKNESQAVVPAPRRDATPQSSAGSGLKSEGHRRTRRCHRPERGLACARRGA